jgi:PAS domain S-box-containing protein
MNTSVDFAADSDFDDTANREPKVLDKYNSLINILRGREEFVLDANGIIISSNLEAVNITGYEESEVIGQPISLFYSEDEKSKALSDLEKAARFGQCVVTGFRLKKRASPFWAKMKIYSLRDVDDRLKGYNVVMYDSTHKAISNERIQTLKDEYLNIFNNPYLGTFKFRMSDLLILQCNPLTLKTIGRDNSDKLQFGDFFASPLEMDEVLKELIKNRKIDGFRFLIAGNYGKNNWGIISARYFEGRGFVEGVLIDVSSQHNQSLEVKRLNAELDSFTYHASHDLRAPLTTIMGLVNLARLEPSTVFNSLKMIEERVHHLDRLLKDLSAVTFNSTCDLEIRRFDFETELDGLMHEWLTIYNSTMVETSFYFESSFFTDPVRMQMILRNLISNAYAYQQPDSKNHRIKIKIRVYPTHVAIKVQDNGIGIEWSLKERVWDMFFKGTARSSGSGLGLYVVKSMVEKLKGKIYFESTLDKGTTFLLTVPNAILGN